MASGNLWSHSTQVNRHRASPVGQGANIDVFDRNYVILPISVVARCRAVKGKLRVKSGSSSTFHVEHENPQHGNAHRANHVGPGSGIGISPWDHQTWG